MSRRSRLTIACMGAAALVLVLGVTVSLAQPFFGTSGDDVITGTDRHDYIAGRNGNDTLNGPRVATTSGAGAATTRSMPEPAQTW